MSNRRVLIVEDDSMVGMLLEDMLASLGHEVAGLVATLDQAIRAAAEIAFDFAVLDVNLGGERIYPLAEVLTRRGIPFVFATGYGSALDPQWRHAPVLHKPFELAELECAMSRALPPA
jgi:DNA-binding response OmpR family regulator